MRHMPKSVQVLREASARINVAINILPGSVSKYGPKLWLPPYYPESQLVFYKHLLSLWSARAKSSAIETLRHLFM